MILMTLSALVSPGQDDIPCSRRGGGPPFPAPFPVVVVVVVVVVVDVGTKLVDRDGIRLLVPPWGKI